MGYENARIGFHLSIQGGISNAAREAMEMRYGAFQLFVTSSRSWAVNEIAADEAERFRDLVSQSGTIPFAHAPYLCNPSSPRSEIRSKTIASLKGNIRNCSLAGVHYLVVHIGSHLGSGLEAALTGIEDSIGSVLSAHGDVELLLENSAGYNNSVGSSFGEIGRIIDTAGDGRVGVCLDTCHAFAAGYDISTKEGTERLMGEIEEYVGLGRVKLLHLNDSRFPLGSGKDRHWNIGKGYIGQRGFSNFFSANRLGTDCFVMEVPVAAERDMEADLLAVRRAMGIA